MKRLFYALLVFLQPTLLFSQTDTDYKKLSQACELWGLVKYFHPSKPGNSFDSAFAAQVPAMLKAKSEEEWKSILDVWLRSVGDAGTRIVGKDVTPPDGVAKLEYIQDSVLLVTISGAKILNDWLAAKELVEQVIAKSKHAKGIVFDLRQQAPMSQYAGYLTAILDYAGLPQYFGTSFVAQTRNLYYSGFKPESGTTSGGYSTNFVVKDFTVAGKYSSKNPKVVWVVNAFSELPSTALSQQQAGVGFILSTENQIASLLPLTNTFRFSDNVTVKYTTDEVVTAAPLQPDYLYTGNENPVEKARAILVSKPESKRKAVAVTGKNISTESPVYPSGKYPTVGYRVLAAAKMYTVIQNFFPYHQYMEKNWRTVLEESLPAFVAAQNEVEYGLIVAKMYANIKDSHGYMNGNKGLDELRGQAPSPLYADFIENKVIVSGLRNDSLCKAKGIMVGDVILKVNGIPTEKLLEKYATYYTQSTPQAGNKLAASFCVRGKEGDEGIFTFMDAKGKIRDIKLTWTSHHNDHAKDVFKRKDIELINPNVGYTDLSRLRPDQVEGMFEQFKNTKVIIFDMRGYPNGTAWTIAPRLTEKENVPLAIFRKPEVLAPNVTRGEMLSSKSYTEFVQIVPPSDKWKYKGKTIMLINQNTMSQAEHTGLFFEAVNNTTFIGSPTVGANGDVTNFQIPGSIWLSFSGQGVWHADGRQLQRLGLQPHVPVQPTIKGMREGKDEVFDKAMKWIGKNIK